MERGLADALIRAAYGPERAIVNVSALARSCGIGVHVMHSYWSGRTPWPADVALLVLAASGRLRTDGGALLLEGSAPPRVVGVLSRLAREGFERRGHAGQDLVKSSRRTDKMKGDVK